MKRSWEFVKLWAAISIIWAAISIMVACFILAAISMAAGDRLNVAYYGFWALFNRMVAHFWIDRTEVKKHE